MKFYLPVLLILLGCSHKKSLSDSRPNIILIYADDLGYGEIASYGQTKIETPNIDRLAAEGMRFTQFYTGSPVCAPSRAILLTGKHSGHVSVRGNDEAGYRGNVWDYKAMAHDPGLEGQEVMPASEVTIAELLKEKGYSTALIGKWGLGYPGSESTPNKQGFDFFYGYNCQRQAHTYRPLHLWKNEERVFLNNDTIAPGTKLPQGLDSLDIDSYSMFNKGDYAPELMYEELNSWVKQVHKSPFFLYWATPIPHLPLQAPQRWVDYYVEKFGDEEPYTTRSAGYGYFPSRYPRATYAAMISYMDEQVGQLMKTLESLGLSDKTLIIFTSDNGFSTSPGLDPEWFNSGAIFKNNNGWGKGYLREGGIRVPFIARWPDRIAAGQLTDHIASMQDLLATCMDVIGSDAPPSDGISLYPLMTNTGVQDKHEYLYWEFPESGGQHALRMGDWKVYGQHLKSQGDTTLYLYNLSTDPQEQVDLSASRPDLIEYARQIMTREHVPSDNPRWRFPVLDDVGVN